MPDFSKLNRGDLLIVEVEFNYGKIPETHVAPGFFNKIDRDEFPFNFFMGSSFSDSASSCRVKLEEIKKITRINIEDRTFEEI